jgi:hypothetical protein
MPLDYDPLTGVLREYTDDDQGFHVTTKQDVQPILDRNIKLQNEEAYKKQGIKNNFQHVADIPLSVIVEWRAEGIDFFNSDHWPAVMRKLRSPDCQYLRTTLGKI